MTDAAAAEVVAVVACAAPAWLDAADEAPTPGMPVKLTTEDTVGDAVILRGRCRFSEVQREL